MADARFYVQYGCGPLASDGWLNFDASPALRLERLPLVGRLFGPKRFPSAVRYGDIVRGLPVPEGACAGVYASHVLEHLPRDDLPAALSNTFRILAPGGIFRLVVPDLEARARLYVDACSHGDATAADGFMDATMLGVRRRPPSIEGRLRAAFGNAAHCWMYDRAGLTAALADAGFVQVRPCRYGDCEDPMFKAVEDPDRFIDGEIVELALEARRPG